MNLQFLSKFLKCNKLISSNDLNIFSVPSQAYIILAFDKLSKSNYIFIDEHAEIKGKFMLKLKVFWKDHFGFYKAFK